MALVVVVLSNGAVEKHTVELARDTDEVTVASTSAWLSQRLTGEPLASAAVVLADMAAARTGATSDRVGEVARAALELLADDHSAGEHVYIGGTSRMASAFDAVATVSDVLTILEQQYVVVTLLQDVLHRGLHVAIGTETGMAPLADCSVVVSTYEVEGEPAGTIGVLGPTRMNYPQAWRRSPSSVSASAGA